MLGYQWSPEELMQFYESYRKHGKDWKKVNFSICLLLVIETDYCN